MNCGSAPEVKCLIHGHWTYFLYYIIIITIIVTESIGCPLAVSAGIPLVLDGHF